MVEEEQIKIFANTAESLLGFKDLKSVFESITKTVCSFFNASASSIMLFDKNREYLTIRHSYNLSPEYLKVVKVRKNEEVAGKVCQEKKIKFVPDIIKVFVEKGDSFSLEWIKKEGLCSYVCAPLILKGEVIGCLNIYYRTPKKRFDDFPHLDFFAKLATLSVEHARIIEEIGEKSKIVLSLEQIGIILASSLDIEKIIEVLLSTAISITKSDTSSLIIIDEENLRVIDAFEFARETNKVNKYKSTARLVNGISGRIAKEKKPLVINDISNFEGVNPVLVRKNRKAVIGVPLIAREKLLGILYVDSYEPREFSDVQIEYLNLLASQASISLDNALLYKKISREAQDASVLYEVGKAFISTLDFDELLNNILRRLIDTFGYLNLAIFLVDEEKKELKLRSYINYPESVKDIKNAIGVNGITGHVAATKEMYYAQDVSKDPYYIPGVKEAKSEVCFPLMIGERLIGVLDVASPEINGFTEDDIRLLDTLSAQVAIALENARLYEETKKLSLTDPLTNLANRRGLDMFIEGEIKRAERYRRPFAFLMIDFDNFKSYNDKFGHTAGDYILQKFSKIMKDSIRDVDFICRYGGDEFVIVLPETDVSFARAVAERIRKKIEVENLDPRVSLSIGISMFPRDTREKGTLINLADRACYEAKEMGGNRVNFAGSFI